MTAGAGCTIQEGANISQSVLWDRVTVEAGAEIRRAVLADGVTAHSGDVFEDCVVVSASLVEGKVSPDKALKGHIQGENFVVPLTV